MSETIEEVIYVDDSPDDRLFAEHLHKRGGYRFRLSLFDGGPAALRDLARRIEEGRPLPALLVADHYMPPIEGPELLRLIRADPAFAGIGLAICSGGDDPEDQRAAREAGASFLLEKPLDLDLCRQILDRRNHG